MENELYEERHEYQNCRNNLKEERRRYEETERNLTVIWSSHKSLGEIISEIKCKVNPDVLPTYSEYNITEIVFELEAKISKAV